MTLEQINREKRVIILRLWLKRHKAASERDVLRYAKFCWPTLPNEQQAQAVKEAMK